MNQFFLYFVNKSSVLVSFFDRRKYMKYCEDQTNHKKHSKPEHQRVELFFLECLGEVGRIDNPNASLPKT
jgi:hypothetical protein